MVWGPVCYSCDGPKHKHSGWGSRPDTEIAPTSWKIDNFSKLRWKGQRCFHTVLNLNNVGIVRACSTLQYDRIPMVPPNEKLLGLPPHSLSSFLWLGKNSRGFLGELSWHINWTKAWKTSDPRQVLFRDKKNSIDWCLGIEKEGSDWQTQNRPMTFSLKWK